MSTCIKHTLRQATMRMIVVFCALISLGVEAKFPFRWTDCTKNKATQAIQVVSVTAGPVPLIHPGPLHLSFSAKVTKPISSFLLAFDFQKHSLLGTSRVPCLGTLGSCVFDGCTFVKSLLNSTRTSAQSISKQAVEMIESVNATIACPVPVENIDVTDYTIKVPDLGTIASVLGDGDYTVQIRTKTPATGEELGCLELDVSLRKKCTGFLCGLGGIGRKK